MGGLEAAPTDQNYRDYIDTVSPPSGPPGGYYNNPYVNRGGSFLSESADDHFFETQKEAAPGDGPAPAGIPGAGPSDMRNFSPGNQPGFIVISQYLTPADNWLFTNKCSGIIAETGGTTSHGAVVARAMGIPAIVGAEDATRIQPGDTVTMDPNTGRIDVNGGDPSYEMGEVMRAANEVVRFVWSAGNAVYSPVTEELTEELAALPYNSVGEEDRSHAQMMEYMMMEDTYDFDDGTIGVIYDDGRAIYYEAITDAPALENWLRSNFPNLVNEVVYKQTAGGIYQPQAEPAMAHVAGEEDLEKAPECPNCGSHTYELISLPNDTRGPADLKCLACKTEFTHDVIRNPKQGDRRSEPGPYDRAPGPLPGDPCPECAAPITEVNGRFICPSCSWYLGVPEHTHIQEPYNFSSKLKIVEADGLGIVARCGNCGSEVNLGEVQQNDGDCPNCQMPLPLLDDLTPRTTMSQSIDEHFIEATEKEAGPVLDGIALAFSSALMGYGAGTAGVQLGTWLANKWVEAGYNRPPSEDEARSFASEYDNEFEYLDENGETKWNHGLYEASSDENLVLDTNGQPIHQGELYLMHSTKYPVPDLVRIVNITPQQIEAHIDSDESGTFPIEIHPAEYINLGYSFEPYEDVSKEASTKEALRHISVTPKRQQELINENMNGRARNFDKLNLDDTHYVPFHDLIPSSIGDEIDSHFMW
jgi:phosphohistidine swiveling domain-containing protein/Zn finger protein HypA/HybF involved in hydrogenase expression